MERALAGRERELAAIIIEPVQGAGGVRAAPTRRSCGSSASYTTRIGAVLIFDEIIAFRVGPNGAQGLFGVAPDLTTLGKIIGGGYAARRRSAAGPRSWTSFDARRPGALSHGGTFNGNPVAAAAGLATLRELTPDRYERLAELGERLRTRLASSIDGAGIDARVDGIASLFQVFAGPTLEGEDGLTREPDALPRPPGRRVPPRAAGHGRDLDAGHGTRCRRPGGRDRRAAGRDVRHRGQGSGRYPLTEGGDQVRIPT